LSGISLQTLKRSECIRDEWQINTFTYIITGIKAENMLKGWKKTSQR
jgi:hypothetical protein